MVGEITNGLRMHVQLSLKQSNFSRSVCWYRSEAVVEKEGARNKTQAAPV
jgi:hypothetical protein